MSNDWFRVSVAAPILGVSVPTLRRMVTSGEVKSRRIGPHGTRIHRSELERLLGEKMPENLAG